MPVALASWLGPRRSFGFLLGRLAHQFVRSLGKQHSIHQPGHRQRQHQIEALTTHVQDERLASPQLRRTSAKSTSSPMQINARQKNQVRSSFEIALVASTIA